MPLKFHICISGFLQSESRCHGILKLAEAFHAEGLNGDTERVLYRPWNADWSAVAEHLWLLGESRKTDIQINIYSYSWGVGWGAVELSKELLKRGLVVNNLVASDGVYRHPLLLMRWTSLLSRDASFSPVIRIPANVLEVHPLHQKQNRPQGHKIVSGRGCTAVIHDSIECMATHQYMDDSPEFHALSLQIAREL